MIPNQLMNTHAMWLNTAGWFRFPITLDSAACLLYYHMSIGTCCIHALPYFKLWTSAFMSQCRGFVTIRARSSL